MVYGNDTNNPAPSANYQRGLRLRLPQAEIDATVDSSTLRCSHLDALRMFSDRGRELPNEFGRIEELNRSVDQVRIEQVRGCKRT